jgi:hypothetical protein
MQENVNARPVLAAAYPMAALLVLVPALEVTAGAWPFQPGDLSWRFGILGIVLKTLVTPVLGITLAMAVAALLEHRRLVRALAALSFVLAAVTAAGAVLFLMDFLQLRAMVSPATRQGMQVASFTALLLAALVAPVCAALGIGGWRAGRGPRGTAPARRAQKESGLLVVPHPRENLT